MPQTDSSARAAGALLIATAILTIIAVVGRVAADADQETLAQSLVYIRVNGFEYGVGGAGRLASGITLIVAAALLMRSRGIRERFATPVLPTLDLSHPSRFYPAVGIASLWVSGAFTAVSGAGAIALAASVSGPGWESAAGGILIAESATTPFQETVAALRALTGKIGFAFAGLGLILAARYQWNGGIALRSFAIASAILGVAMQFIWIDAATIAHRITGPLFFLWLLIVGAALVSGWADRQAGKWI